MKRYCTVIKTLNFLAVCLCSMFLLNSCSLQDPPPPIPEEPAVFAPPVYTGKNFKGYVDEMNWYMIYMFSYTQVLNDYAVLQGWAPPKEPPLCRYVEIPALKPVPVFEPKGGYRGGDFERELINYAKSLNRQYREQVDTVHASQDFQKKYMCVY